MEKLKKNYNETQENQSREKEEQNEINYSIEENKDNLIKFQNEYMDNKNILNNLAQEDKILENKINYDTKKIKYLENGKISITKKIQKIQEDKKNAENDIKKNIVDKEKFMESAKNQMESIEEIEKEIQKLLTKKENILQDLNLNNEKIEKIEANNLVISNQITLMDADLNYLEINFSQKEKAIEVNKKNVNDTKIELEKIKKTENVYIENENRLNSISKNITENIKISEERFSDMEKNLHLTSKNLDYLNKRILNNVDEINSLQSNVNSLLSNEKNNKLSKKNFQISIKNIIENLQKKNIFNSDGNYYEYLDIMKLKEEKKPKDIIDNKENLDELLGENIDTKQSLSFNFQKKIDRLKENLRTDYYNSLDENTKKENTNELTNTRNRLFNSEIKFINKETNKENKDKANDEENDYNDLDEIIQFSKEDLKRVLEDYIIFDYDKISKKLNEYENGNQNSGNENFGFLKRYSSEVQSELNNKLFENLKSDEKEEIDKIKKPFKKAIDTNENYLQELSLLDEKLLKNKSDYKENKKRVVKLKEEFLKLNKELKEETFSEFKVLLDMIELEIKQNNFTNESYEKIKKIIEEIR